MSLPEGFTIEAKIHESDQFIVFRVKREQDNRPLILKLPRPEYPDSLETARLIREYELLRRIEAPGVIKAVELIQNNYHPALIQEDFGGEALEDIMIKTAFELGEFLEIALQTAEALDAIHSLGIIHNRINPGHLLYNPCTSQIKITGFAAAFTDSGPKESLPSIQFSAYMAPEQTERLGRMADQRTDLYSLGIVFFKLLTGQLPFAPGDPLGEVSFHLAKEAPSINSLLPEIPLPVSRMVAKLMAKNPDERYQNAKSLAIDIKTYLNQWQSFLDNPPAEEFVLTEPFTIQARLYGREVELNRLEEKFSEACQGKLRLILVRGDSGVGKTALIAEFKKKHLSAGAIFSAGKPDQYLPNAPYSLFVQVLRGLVQIILSENEEGFARWQRKIEAAVGAKIQLLVELLPELGKVSTLQAALPPLPLAEAQNRFNRTLMDFLQLFASAAQPVVIFLDDLQWADQSDLRLLDTVLASRLTHMMIIGAYRSHEVSPGGPLESFLAALEDQGPYDAVHLEPLSVTQADQLIRETLNATPGASKELTAICLQKTGGNPFFLKQFLYAMQDQGLISFNRSRRGWFWDEQKIARTKITANVVDLLVLKFEKLPPRVRMVLETAACIGNCFDSTTLAAVMGETPSVLRKILQKSIEEALILAEDSGLESLSFPEQLPEYRFVHDRIHQTAYSLIPDSLKKQYHLKIGRAFWSKLAEDFKVERLYEITAHFNLAQAIITDEADRLLLIRLNQTAAEKAKNASAYEAVLEYATAGITAFQDIWWEKYYYLGLSLHIQGAEAAAFLGKFELVEQYADSGLARVKTVIDSVELYRIKIEAYTMQFDVRTLTAANDILKRLGVSFPKRPTWHHVWSSYRRLRQELRRKSFMELSRLPILTDQRQLAIIKIIDTIALTLYYLHSENPYLFYLQNFYVLRIFLKHGNSPDAAMFFVIYAYFLCGFVQDYRTGYQFGRLALEMAAANPAARSWEYKLKYYFNSSVLPFGEPLQNSIAPDICRQSLQYGDWRMYIYSYTNILFGQFFSGQPLPEIFAGMDDFQEKIKSFRGQMSLDFYGMYRQLLLNLCGETDDPKRLVGDAYDETGALSDALRMKIQPTIFAIYFFKLYLSYLYGAFPEALELISPVEAYLNSHRGLYFVPLARFYMALVLLSGDQVLAHPRRSWKKINRIIADLQKLAGFVPANFENKVALLLAERARIKGDFLRAGEYYDRSIAAAGQNGNLSEAGLANELAARFWLARRLPKVAAVYLKEAHYAYSRWGAKAKVATLEREYPNVFWFQAEPVKNAAGQDISMSPPVIGGEPDIDFLAVIRACQAISEALSMEELLHRLIRILLQDSGASRAVFLANRDGKLRVEAAGDVLEENVRILQGISLELADLPRKMIHYCVRLQESVLWEAIRGGLDFDDPFLQSRELQAVLCLPVLTNGQLIGVLYLENNLLAGVFSAASRELLKLLAAQLAISIEKARQYETLETTVAIRTVELHHKNDELLAVNTQLAAANAAKNEFVANVSHEIRTPLQGIAGMLSLLEKTAADSKQSEYLQMLGNSTQSLREIVDDILDLARIEAKQISLECKVFDIRRLAGEVAGVFTPVAAAKGLELGCVYSPQLPRLVMGDPLRLRQILVNLINNAIKYTDHGAIRLLLEAEGSDGCNCRIRIEVRDTGIGIPQDKLESIFEAFSQVDSGVSRRLGGVGLGLSITKSLVELMQGKITVTSEISKGSRFSCTVSLGITPEGSLPQTDGDSFQLMRESGELAGLRVIVAEDNPVNRKYLTDILQLLGCRVRAAANGREALEAHASGPCDCLFVDQNMPELDGLATIRAIRSQESQTGRERLPIAVLTAAVLAGEKESLLEAGADYYLAKPVRENQLLNVLRQIKGIPAALPETAAGSMALNRDEVEAGLIDTRTIMEEAQSFGKEVMAETLRELTARYPEQLAAVAREIERRNFPGLKQAAHRLAGTFANAFAPGLQKIARRIEEAAISETAEEAGAAYAELVLAATGFPEQMAEVIETIIDAT